MKFSYYDLGHLSKGQVVEVCLSAAANVRLLDSSNYSNYKNGRRHRYYGGYVKKSPYRIIVPNSGHWYITIDLGGYSGTVKHSVQVLPGVLPAARTRIPLANEPNLYVEAPEANISRSFIKKGWTNYELDGLMTKAISGQQTLLPIWHDITKQEVIDYSPSLADKVARNTSQETVEEIANEIADMILGNYL